MTIINKESHIATTARIAGVWYLALAISGILGFLIFHPKIFDSKDAQKTLINLMNQTPNFE